MKNIIQFLLLVFSVFTNTIPLFAQWVQTNGPYGGSIKCFAVSGTNLFAGASVGTGGVFLSTDNGISWNAVNSGLTNTSVLSLAVSGTNLFAGTDSGGVFLSSNNGTSWTAVNSGLTNTVVNALAVNGSHLFAGTSNGGVFLSTNNGTSWTAVNSGLTNTVVLSLAVSGTNLFAGTSYGGVFLSTNDGTSWTPVNSGLTNTIVNVLAVSGTNLFAGTDGGGVFLSTDNGTSWNAPGLTNLTVNALAVSGTNLFAGINGFGAVFLSTNNGASWTAANSGLPNTGAYALAVSGMNLFAGTNGGGVFHSTNNGTSWTAVNSGLTNTSVYSFAVSGTNLVAGTVENNTGTSYGGGVFLSTNDGTSWTPINSGLPSAGVHALAVNGTNLFAGTFGGVFLSTNYGTSWSASSPMNQVVGSLAVSGTNLFAGLNWVGIFLSTNNGTSWTPVNSGLTNMNVNAFAFSGTNLFAGTGNGVFLSTNDGSSWTAVNSGLINLGVFSLAVSPALGGTGGTNLFAGTNNGGVFLSTNNGTSWTAVNSGLPNTDVLSLVVSPISSGTGGTNLFAGTNNGGIFLSTNNGTSWSAVNTGLTNTNVRSLAVSGTNLFAGTSFGGVWKRALIEMGNSLLSLTRLDIDQGAIRLGQTKRDAFTLRNSGTNTLNITSITATNPAWSVSQTALVIPPDQSIIDTAIFTPSSFGSASGKIIIISDSPTSPDTISVKGNSPVPTITSIKSFITFGSIAKNMTRTDTVKIVNSSINTLIADSIYTKTGIFTVNRASGSAGTDTLKIAVSFTPTAFAMYADTLYLRNNSMTPLVKIPLTGISPSPLLTVSTASLTFSNRANGDSASLILYLRNMSINSMTITHNTTTTSIFAAAVGSTTVAGQDSTVLTVKFKPTAFGSFIDTVAIVSDGGTAKIPLVGSSPFPILVSTKTSVVFGNVVIHSLKNDSIKISNTSINMLTIDSIYTQNTAFVSSLTRGTVESDTLTIGVAFIPNAMSNFTDTLFLRNNSVTPLVKIPLYGNAPAPLLNTSSTSLAFADRAKGDSAVMILYLKNNSINAMTINSVTTANSVFTTTTGSMTVLGLDSTALTVKFKPISYGTFFDTVAIVSDGGTAKIAVSGASPTPSLTSLKSSITYESVAKNMTKKDTVKVINSSINTLTVDSIYTKTSAFVVDRSSGTVGTDTLKIVVSFTPAALASYSDTLFLRNNSAVPSVKIPLLGNCPAPILSASVLSLTFAHRAKGDSASITSYLRNISVNSMIITNITTGTNTFAASVGSTTIAGQDSTILTVKFKPISYGTFSDTVIVVSDGGTAKIVITGASPTPILTSLKSSLAFGSVGKNKTKVDTLRIIDGSVNTLIVDSIYTKTSAFVVSRLSGTLGRDTMEIVISFAPMIIGNYGDTVYLRNNSTIPLVKIPLSGYAPAPALVCIPHVMNFGIIKKDSTSLKPFVMTDTSMSALSIDSIYTKTKYFNLTSIINTPVIFPLIVDKGDTISFFVISFKPDTARTFFDTLYVKNNSNQPLMKIPLNGNGTLTVVENKFSGIPNQYELSQNFPNPFNPSTTIRYSLPLKSQVRLQIFNTLGQMVKELVNIEQAPGYQSVIWNATVASGMYFYRLQAGSYSETKKLILLK